MRLPFRHRRAVRPPEPLGSGLLALAALAPSLTQAIALEPAPSANLDFSNLGRIAIAGDFDGISRYEFQGQTSKPLSTNSSESLCTRLPNGVLAPVVSTDASVRSMCTFTRKNGDFGGVVVGGNFTSLGGTKSTAIAIFDPNTTKVTALDGLKGEVHAVYCDRERDTVYVGGRFRGANSTNALAWVGSDGWTSLPFAGFNGPVGSITKSSNGHIIFGGSFSGLGNASAPSRPDEQIINLSTANVTATNSASTSGFSDPKSVICSGDSDGPGQAWLLQDQTPGTWEANFGFGFEPIKLRLWNTRQDGRGTKTFRFFAFPINGIMNLTYVDPATGQNTTCTSECPLSNDPKVEFQDFHFVNRVGMNSFQIAISAWYGGGGGLAGVQLFQDDIFAYAISTFNEPKFGGTQFPSSATSTGPWKQSPSLQSNADYMTAELSGPVGSDSASVVFYPSIRQSGNYSVNMYTPGCIPDSTCETRGQVNVTGTMSTGTVKTDFSTTLFQTNNFDKYDQIYFGYIEKTSDTFKPSVTITPLAGQNVGKLTVVAQRIGFTLTNSTGGLNGLFDYDPDSRAFNTSDLDKSAINKLGSGFDRDAGVTSLATAGDVTYIGGNFTSDKLQNIVAIGGPKEEVQSLGGGLNGQVLAMHLEGSKLYVGGDFNARSGAKDGLDHVAVYDAKNNSWIALGAGVNGKVQFLVPLPINVTADNTETAITLTGTFSECRGFSNNKAVPVDGFAVWVPSQGNWLQNLDSPVPAYSGILTGAVVDLPNNDTLFPGSVLSAQLAVNGAATLSNQGLGKLPVKIQAQQPQGASTVQHRDVLANGAARGVVTGTFYDSGDSNITIMAGHFAAQSSGGTIINNLVLIDGKDGSVSGLGPGVSADSTFATVALRGSVLYAGGKVSGTVEDRQINGLVAYDVNSMSFSKQPAPVAGGSGTVSAISVRRDTDEVYVGGSFRKAGALDCPGVCMYKADSDQWSQLGGGLAGNVLGLMWSSDSVLVASGDMVANGTETLYLASYNAKRQAWTSFPGADRIPGPVQVMTPASSDGNQIWVGGKSVGDGSVFLMKYDGSKWQSAEPALPASTVLRSLQVFSLTQGHDKTDMLDEKQALMVTGSVDVPQVGAVSAVIYNGTHYQPYALTMSSGRGAGTIAKIFTQKDDFFSSQGGQMPLAFVVLIGLAIALGLILLLVLGGIMLDRLRKRREGYTRAPTSMYDWGSGIQRIPPRELLESLGRSRPGAPQV